MKNQKTLQKTAQFGRLCAGQPQARKFSPIAFQKGPDNFFRARRQARRKEVRFQPQLVEQLQFQRKYILRPRRLAAEPAEKSVGQFKNLRQRRLRFRRQFDERGRIGGLLQFKNVFADCAMRFALADFAEVVQIGTAAAAEGKIRAIKNIQPSRKRRLRPARALGHRGDAPKIWREPVDNQARLRKWSRAQNDAVGRLDHFIFTGNCSGAMEPRLTMYLMPSATLMSSLVTFSSGTKIRKPEVGFGVVGMKTPTRFFPIFFCASPCVSFVM